MKKAVSVATLALVVVLALSAASAGSVHDPAQHPTLDPAPPPQRGVDSTAIIVAGAAIVVAGGAGIWIYRVIRKGL